MEFSLSPEQHEFRASIIEFARETLNRDIEERDEDGTFSRDLWNACAGFGLQGLVIPEEHGGMGFDAVTAVVALEALGYGCLDNGLAFAINAHMWSAAEPIARFGSKEQKERYLPGLCGGELIGVQGMTEPGSGSDAFSLRTRAEQKGDAYVLNGSKTFISNAPHADVFVVFASTDPSFGALGISAFLVDRSVKGLTVGNAFKKMGIRTAPLSELYFDDVEVTASAMLGKRGNGMAIFNHSIDWERCCILASALGAMEREIEASVAYACEREQFGRPIGKFQAVSHRIVDMKMRHEAARLILYKAAWTKACKGGAVSSMESAMAKLAVSEAWVQTSLDALQIRGGSGYMTETGVERQLRDAVASRIYSGTSDIQRNIIAGAMGL